MPGSHPGYDWGAAVALMEIKNLSYTYPFEEAPALREVNLHVDEGELVVVSGENEAGKSTLCAVVSGLIPHFYHGKLEGSVAICGIEIADTPRKEWVHKVGMVMQNPFNQITGARFSVAEEVAFGMENLGIPREEMRRRVGKTLDQIGIRHLAERPPITLSGGQQQLVALAGALVMNPALLVLDEPTSQLDPQASQRVLDLVGALRCEGLGVLLVEHKMEWAAEHADRLVVLERGSVTLEGQPRKMLAELARLNRGVRIPAVTLIADEARREGFWPADKELPATVAQAVEGFRL